jgi:hypothetical protein
VFLRNSTFSGLIEALRIHGNHDAVLIGTGIAGPITVRWCALTMNRDDAVENDNETPLTIENCLIESFVITSNRGGSSNGANIVTMQNNLCYSLPCRIDGEPDRTQVAFKMDSGSSRYNLYGNSFAATNSTYSGSGQLFRDLLDNNKLDDSVDNHFYWLGAGSNPHTLPSGFTLHEGAGTQAAWEALVSTWWSNTPIPSTNYITVANGFSANIDPYTPGA